MHVCGQVDGGVGGCACVRECGLADMLVGVGVWMCVRVGGHVDGCVCACVRVCACLCV